MKMIQGIRSYLSDNLPKNGHPWLEMGIWIGIAEGQSTSPDCKICWKLYHAVLYKIVEII